MKRRDVQIAERAGAVDGELVSNFPGHSAREDTFQLTLYWFTCHITSGVDVVCCLEVMRGKIYGGVHR